MNNKINKELKSIISKHGLFKNKHEAYAVLKEEIEESKEDLEKVLNLINDLWVIVRNDSLDNKLLENIEDIESEAHNCIEELIQVIAVCQKIIISEKEEFNKN